MTSTYTSSYHEIMLIGLDNSFQRYQESYQAWHDFSASETSDSFGSEALEKFKRKRKVIANRLSVYMFAASFLEAIINYYMIINLPKEEFEALEKLSPPDKWMLAPKLIDPNYHLSKGQSPHQELSSLFERRNAVMHHKAIYKIGGKTKYKGLLPKVDPKEHQLVEKIYNLPRVMMLYILQNEKVSDTWDLFVFGCGIDMDRLADWFGPEFRNFC